MYRLGNFSQTDKSRDWTLFGTLYHFFIPPGIISLSIQPTYTSTHPTQILTMADDVLNEVLSILEDALAWPTTEPLQAHPASPTTSACQEAPSAMFHDRVAEIVHAVRKQEEGSKSGEYSSYKIWVRGTGAHHVGGPKKHYSYEIFRRYSKYAPPLPYPSPPLTSLCLTGCSFQVLKNMVRRHVDRYGDAGVKAAVARFPKKTFGKSTRDAVIADRIAPLNEFLSALQSFSLRNAEVRGPVGCVGRPTALTRVMLQVRSMLSIFLAPDEDLTDNFSKDALRKFQLRLDSDELGMGILTQTHFGSSLRGMGDCSVCRQRRAVVLWGGGGCGHG